MMTPEKFQLEMAVAQFTGWREARSGGNGIIGLVESMGLDEREWDTLKRQGDVDWLPEDEKQEIEEFFARQKAGL